MMGKGSKFFSENLGLISIYLRKKIYIYIYAPSGFSINFYAIT